MSTAGDLMVRLLLNTNGFDRNIQSSTRQVQDFQRQMSEVGKTVNSFGQGLGINIGQLTKFGTAAGAAATAGKVLSDAFMMSETNADNFRAAMEQCKAAYNQFLNSLNTGNWNNFFKNLNSAVKGAEELYRLFDEAGSTKANNAVAIATAEKAIALAKQELLTNKNITAERKKHLQDIIKYNTERIRILKAEGTEATKAAANKGMFNVIRNRTTTTLSGSNVKVNDKDVIKYIDAANKEGQKFFKKQERISEELRKKGTKVVQRSRGTTSAGISLGTYDSIEFDVKNLSANDQKRYALAEAFKDQETQFQEFSAMYKDATVEETQAIEQNTNALKIANKETSVKTPKVKASIEKPDEWEGIFNSGIFNEQQISLLKSLNDTEKKSIYPIMQRYVDETQKNRYLTKKYGDEDGKIAEKQYNIIEEIADQIGLIGYQTDSKNLSDLGGSFGLMTSEEEKKWKEKQLEKERAGILQDVSSFRGVNPNNYNEQEIKKAARYFNELWQYLNTKNEIFPEATYKDALERINGLRNAYNKFSKAIDDQKDINYALNSFASMGQSIADVFNEAGEAEAAFFLQSMSDISALIAQIANMCIVNGVSSAAKLPYPANLGAMASTVAVIAGIVGNAMNTFAGGGIVQGSGSGWSDSVAVRVSNGEMILNRRQQGNLFALLDGNRVSSGSLNGDVRFRLQGRELIGLINNETNKQSKVL